MLEAQRILLLAEEALKMLETETDKNRFNVECYAAICSLRSVGHVLDKVDRKNNAVLEESILKWWADLHQHADKEPMFFSFIEQERNQLLKDGIMNFDNENYGGFVLFDQDKNIELLPEIGDEFLFVPMRYGTYAGEDIRDMIGEAITWWKTQFDKMGIN